jgi:hypothetical protein
LQLWRRLHIQHILNRLNIMSSKSKSTAKVDALLATIQQKLPSTPEPAPEQELKSINVTEIAALRPKATTATKQIKNRVGKPVQFWMHDEDRRLIRELAAWLAGQGERPTDSLVIRSALRMASTGGDLLKAYRQASQLDGRLKQHRNS